MAPNDDAYKAAEEFIRKCYSDIAIDNEFRKKIIGREHTNKITESAIKDYTQRAYNAISIEFGKKYPNAPNNNGLLSAYAAAVIAGDPLNREVESIRNNMGNTKGVSEEKRLPVGYGKTILQPAIVAKMMEALNARKGYKILEVGASNDKLSNYLSAAVGKNGKIIITEESTFAEPQQKNIKKEFGEPADFDYVNRPTLAVVARKRFSDIKNIEIVASSRSLGYEKEAPYDRIIVTVVAPIIADMLVKQLGPDGRMVVYLANDLVVVTKDSAGEAVQKSFGEYSMVQSE